MNSMRIASQRIIYAVAAFAMIVAVVLPAIASAAQVSERSVALSNASAGATDVTYTVNFTPVSAAAAFVVDFCKNSPLIGETCTAPDDFSASAATTTSAGFTVDSTAATRAVVFGSLTASTPVSVALTGITNPSAAGALYARVVTFDTTGNATSSTPTTMTGNVDDGGAAIAITPTIGVSGVVLETLTFCVSGTAIGESCTTGVTPPVLELGEPFGGVVALQPDTLSQGNIHTQISTNAVGGVVVHLKSNATGCGGLLLIGDTEKCYIAPALDNGIADTPTDALFGVKAAAATATPSVTNASGTLQPVPGSFYAPTGEPAEYPFAMNYVGGDATGVTSTFGDPFLNTADAPANNMNMALTFGASATNNTPAGTYSANLSLIAVGKF